MANILALETSSDYCSVAYLGAPRAAYAAVRAGQSHSERLLAMVAAVLAEAGVALAGCDAIAFGAGPGSFTGLRIACAVAQGLAFGAGLPVVGVGTLQALAEEALHTMPRPPGAGTRILAVQDARMGEVYWSLSVVGADGDLDEEIPATLSAPRELAALVPVAAFGCGNAFELHPDVLGPLVEARVAVDHADARAVARLAERALRAGRACPPDEAAPLYVRDRVALTMAQRAERRAPIQ